MSRDKNGDTKSDKMADAWSSAIFDGDNKILMTIWNVDDGFFMSLTFFEM